MSPDTPHGIRIPNLNTNAPQLKAWKYSPPSAMLKSSNQIIPLD
jgi:hypothetical protein